MSHRPTNQVTPMALMLGQVQTVEQLYGLLDRLAAMLNNRDTALANECRKMKHEWIRYLYFIVFEENRPRFEMLQEAMAALTSRGGTRPIRRLSVLLAKADQSLGRAEYLRSLTSS